jgi:hypothetical protein
MKSKLLWWAAPVLVLAVLAAALWVRQGLRQAHDAASSSSTAPSAAAIVVPSNAVVESSAPSTVRPEEMTDIVPCGASSSRLLASEPLLNDNRIGLAMAAAEGDSAVRVPCPDFTSAAFFALTPHGLEPLSGDATQANTSVEWGCGERFSAVALTAQHPVEKGNLPIAVGEEVPKLLTWLPAKRIDATVDCPPPAPSFTRKQQQLFEITGRTGRWALESWELPEQAGKAPSEGVPLYLDVWSRISADGQCVIVARSEQDLDGKPLAGEPPLRGIYGLLRFEKEQVQKSWLLFNSPGYEGEGIAAAELDPNNDELTLRGADAIVYSGC